MRRVWIAGTFCAALSACVTRPPPPPVLAPAAWPARLEALQHATRWQLNGRAAAAVGEQGWQASLDWRETADGADVHLAGPLGVGATELKQTPAGLSVNGAAPSDAVLAQLQTKLGFELPIGSLRYWLLGVPQPDAPFALTANAQDRAQQVIQAGWTIDYDRYGPVAGDVLPTRLVLSREGVRVRVAVDHWEAPR